MNVDREARLGFSNLETAAAILLLGVLTAVVLPAVFRRADEAKYGDVVRDVHAIERALAAYYADVGTLVPLDDVHGFGTAPDNPALRHFVTGDGTRGWNGPYLEPMLVGTRFGGTWDVDVFNATQASIDLGTRSRMGASFDELLEALDDLLDGDDDPRRGRVWGDSNGIHVGFNYVMD